MIRRRVLLTLFVIAASVLPLVIAILDGSVTVSVS